ncbi:DUF1523 family protein [Bacillus tropicus]
MKKLIALLSILSILTVFAVGCASHPKEDTEKETITGVVVDKYNKRDGDVDKFYVVVDDGEEEYIFENTDSVFFMKFDSADVQAKLRVGKKYKFETFGFRVKSLSAFPNITKATKIQEHKE